MLTDQDFLWKILTTLRNQLKLESSCVDELVIYVHGKDFSIEFNRSPRKNETGFIHILPSENTDVGENKLQCALFITANNFVTIKHNTFLSESLVKMLELYLALSLNPQKARKLGRAVAVAHFAQTLDGKIATSTGHSRWISGEENLVHAHRMRALCGGVLIGMNTLLSDRPLLTVRHVEGENPVKIVVGNSKADYTSLLESGDKVVLITNADLRPGKNIHLIKMSSNNELLDPLEILKVIYEKLNIHTVYIEGGSFTSSHFLKTRALQHVQMFLSPLIFGSGISNFSFPNINEVNESLQFLDHRFISMGNGMLFIGEPKYS